MEIISLAECSGWHRSTQNKDHTSWPAVADINVTQTPLPGVQTICHTQGYETNEINLLRLGQVMEQDYSV
jgi:hypothetical protein